MPIVINYVVPEPTLPTYAPVWEDDDACSILVPLDVLSMDPSLVTITAGGVALPEDAAPAWSNTDTYGIGDQVHHLATHRVYESLKDNNIGKDPTVLANRVSAAGVGTWWLEVGPTNRAAMFDGLVSSKTYADSPLVIKLRPGAFNGFALFGIEADQYSVTVKDAPGGNTIYYQPLTSLDASTPGDYYEYFFSPFKPLTRLVRTDIEPYGSAEITLILTKASGQVGLGMFAIGDMRPIGIPQRDASVEPIDYSYVKTDQYGNSTVRKGAVATGMSITTKMDKELAGLVLDTVQQVLGTPCVVVGSKAQYYEWMTVFGLISGRMSPADYPFATLSITVKGLI